MHQTLVLVPKSMTPYYTVIHGSQCYHFMFHVYWFLFLKKLFCLPIGHGTFISLFCELHQDISKTFDLLYHLLFTLLSFSFRVSQVIWHTQIVGLQALVIGNMFWLTLGSSIYGYLSYSLWIQLYVGMKTIPWLPLEVWEDLKVSLPSLLVFCCLLGRSCFSSAQLINI